MNCYCSNIKRVDRRCSRYSQNKAIIHKKFNCSPKPLACRRFCRIQHQTRYTSAKSGWKRKNSRFFFLELPFVLMFHVLNSARPQILLFCRLLNHETTTRTWNFPQQKVEFLFVILAWHCARYLKCCQKVTFNLLMYIKYIKPWIWIQLISGVENILQSISQTGLYGTNGLIHSTAFNDRQLPKCENRTHHQIATVSREWELRDLLQTNKQKNNKQTENDRTTTD